VDFFSDFGGALLCTDVGFSIESSVTVEHDVFLSNTAGSGGAVAIATYNANNVISFAECEFRSNSALGELRNACASMN
jgi:hypothetical protein